MTKQIKKLTLKRETIRDLTARNAGEVKGGDKSKMCPAWTERHCTKHTCRCPSLWCSW